MAKVTPLCPKQADGGVHIVKALRGSGRDHSGRDFYAYGCSCGTFWRQIRANQLKPGEQADIDFNVNVSSLMLAAQAKQAGVRPAPVRKPQGGGYLCSRCHLPKKGHVCLAGKRPLDATVDGADPTAAPMAMPPKTAKNFVVALPEWYVQAAEQTRSEMHTFVWAVEKAGIDWTSEFALEFMRRFNLTPSQASEMVQLFRSASAIDDQSAPRCDKCNFTALDEDGALVRCSRLGCSKHRHLICGACEGFKCETCEATHLVQALATVDSVAV